jgi:hypothetical protein
MDSQGDHIPPPRIETQLCICAGKATMGRIEHSMAARVPKKKNIFGCDFPQSHPTRRYCKAGSSVFVIPPLGVGFFFIVSFWGWLHESGRCLFGEQKTGCVCTTILWRGLFLGDVDRVLVLWVLARVCVCVNRNDEWEGYPIGIRYQKCSRWLSLFLLQS